MQYISVAAKAVFWIFLVLIMFIPAPGNSLATAATTPVAKVTATQKTMIPPTPTVIKQKQGAASRISPLLDPKCKSGQIYNYSNVDICIIAPVLPNDGHSDRYINPDRMNEFLTQAQIKTVSAITVEFFDPRKGNNYCTGSIACASSLGKSGYLMINSNMSDPYYQAVRKARGPDLFGQVDSLMNLVVEHEMKHFLEPMPAHGNTSTLHQEDPWKPASRVYWYPAGQKPK